MQASRLTFLFNTIDGEDTLAFSVLENIRPLIETVAGTGELGCSRRVGEALLSRTHGTQPYGSS